MRIADDYFQPLVKVQPLTFSGFLSNIGGCMGLLAGVSVLSVFEIFYLIINHFLESSNKVYSLSSTRNEKQMAWIKKDKPYWFTKPLVDFVSSSDILGILMVKNHTHRKIGRVLWALLVALLIAICSKVVFDMYKYAKKLPVVTRIDSQVLTLNDVRKL
jgi:Amiloride-sensitive sodium channel